MQLVISASRAVLPHAGNQLGSLHDSKFISNVSVNLLRDLPDHERRNIHKSMDPATRDDANGERAESLVSLVAAASHRAGNCGELNSFCFHLLASLPEMKPYRLEHLHSEELNHQMVVAYVNGKPLVCDAWPQYPMAAPASEVLPAWRHAFFPEDDDWRFEILDVKLPNVQSPAFPVDDVLDAATKGSGRKAALAEMKEVFGNESAYARYSLRNLGEAPRLYSVLYSSNPGLHYLADDGQRFNLRYLYPPATHWSGDHVQ